MKPFNFTKYIKNNPLLEEGMAKKQQFFGMSEDEYNDLIAAYDKELSAPADNKIATVKKYFPKIGDQEAIIAIKLLYSPNQRTSTRYDVMSYLNKYK